jgi:hypothetical protein
MSKLVFEHAITSSLGSIRYCSVSTGIEPNLPISNTLGTEVFKEPISTDSQEPNLPSYRRTEPIGSVFTECPSLPANNTFLSEQTSHHYFSLRTNQHQSPAKRTGS